MYKEWKEFIKTFTGLFFRIMLPFLILKILFDAIKAYTEEK